jgi:hypothetical protein
MSVFKRLWQSSVVGNLGGCAQNEDCGAGKPRDWSLDILAVPGIETPKALFISAQGIALGNGLSM